MTVRASPRQILALASCSPGQPLGCDPGIFSCELDTEEVVAGGRLTAALTRKSPLPEPISSSTGWSLPKEVVPDDRRGHVADAGLDQVRRDIDGGASAAMVRAVSSRVGSGGIRQWIAAGRRRSRRVAVPGGSATRFRGFRLADGHADDLAVEDHVGADESLAIEHGVPAMQPNGLGDENEAVAGPHLTAEADVLHAAEGDESLFVYLGFVAEKARELGGRFAHEHAGQERVIGHVSRGPRTRRRSMSL